MRASTFVFTTLERPLFNQLNGTPFSAETVARRDDYLTRIRLSKPTYLTKFQELFPTAKFTPKRQAWKELALDAYYKNEGNFTPGENYWSEGE